MGEQMCLFDDDEIEMSLTEEDVIRHKLRMVQQAKSKSGALSRLAKARHDDLIAKQVAEENLRLREEVSMLKKLVARTA